MSTHTVPSPARWKLIAGFVAIFLIWGSTYLAIRFAVHSLPPFSMSGLRFITAGLVLYAWTWLRDGGRPTMKHWGTASIGGVLMMLIGMGAVAWVEQWVSSGPTALLVATSPAWMVLMNWLGGDGVRPGWRVWTGLALGLLGMSLLVGPDDMQGTSVSPLHLVILILCSVSWVAGSLYTRRADKPQSQPLYTAMIMLTGGIWLVIAGAATGEWQTFSISQVTWTSVAAFAYLTIVGSLVAFTVYVWLMRVASPAHVATHAYVNPVVAVVLGWLLGGEALTWEIGVAATGIVLGVVLMMSDRPGDSSETNTKLASAEEELSVDPVPAVEDDQRERWEEAAG
ncbi:MAG: EamA family transporter [Candidatus Latescibacteria bacterium]|jgi:drug/metabolite transporter (DMT)-like permease|nr:EamA family transporter [Candidatus Latescibacterota bacterium]